MARGTSLMLAAAALAAAAGVDFDTTGAAGTIADAAATAAIGGAAAEAAADRVVQTPVQVRFGQWVSESGKFYADSRELQYRQRVFLNNMAMVDAHNAQYPSKTGFLMGPTRFADLTTLEYTTRHSTSGFDLLSQRSARAGKSRQLRGEGGGTAKTAAGQAAVDAEVRRLKSADARQLQTSWDWVAAGAVNTPMDCGPYCWCSWAATGAAAVEGMWKIAMGYLVKLSVQEFLDCTDHAPYNCNGCVGGWSDGPWLYMMDRPGVASWTAYPWVGSKTPCDVSGNKPPIAFIGGIVDVPNYDDAALATAVTSNPVAIMLNSANTAFQFYTTGVIDEYSVCTANPTDAGLAVGFGVTPGGMKYFKIKFSYGTGWGEAGFVRVQRAPYFEGNAGVCGMYLSPMYPIPPPLVSQSHTPTPTSTPTYVPPSQSSTNTRTATPTRTGTGTSSPTSPPTQSDTSTLTPPPTPPPSQPPTPTGTPAGTPPMTPPPTPPPSQPPTPTSTPPMTPPPTQPPSQSKTATITSTRTPPPPTPPSQTGTFSPTNSRTNSFTPIPTPSGSATPTASESGTPSAPATPSASSTATSSASATASATTP